MAEIYNNPGNIQIGQGFAGTVGEYASDRKGEGKKPFVEFDSPQMGLRAVYRDLQSKIKDFDGDVAKIINKYAPGNENKTQAYIDSVIKQIGSETITADNIDEAVRAIVRHENGTNSETTKYYLDDPNLLKEAKELAKHNLPATMTYKKAAETYLPKKEEVAREQGKTQGVSTFEAQLQAAENEGKKLFPTYEVPKVVAAENENAALMPNFGAPKVAAAPAVSPNFNVAGGYNPNKAAENVMSQYGKRPREVIKETETITEEGPGFIDRIKSGFEELYPFNEGGAVNNTYTTNYTPGGTVNQAQGLASLGRGGDSTLVHMQPQEVAGLQQLAQSNGTSLTRNPMTGYPEAFSLKGVLKAAAPIAAGYFLGPAASGLLAGTGTAAAAGTAAATTGAMAAGAATGASIAAISGEDPIMGAVSGGLGGMSGGGLEGAFAGVPEAFAGNVASTVPQTATNAIGGANLTTAGGKGLASATGNMGNIGGSALTTQGGAGFAPPDFGMTNATMPGNVGTSTPGGFKAGYNKFMDNVSNITATDEILPSTRELSTGIDPKTGEYIRKTGERIPGSFLAKAKTIGSPIASLGLGGLEQSDFINKPDFNDPRDKYDPRSKLDLSRDTGISEAMSRDTGLRLLAKGGYLKGPGDGMSDDIPATINGDEPAALADGEFVIPADVVSHLGNGSSEAGSKQLYAMMDRIRKARTGRESQGKEIKPGKYMPR